MIFCEYCNEKRKNDEWRENLISDKHLVPQRKKLCKICRKTYDSILSDPTS